MFYTLKNLSGAEWRTFRYPVSYSANCYISEEQKNKCLPSLLIRKQTSIFVWHSTGKCVLGYTLLWHFMLNYVRNAVIFKWKSYHFS